MNKKYAELDFPAWFDGKDVNEAAFCREFLSKKDIQTELSPLYADVKRLWAIHYNIYEVQHEQERQQTQLRSRKNEIEL